MLYTKQVPEYTGIYGMEQIAMKALYKIKMCEYVRLNKIPQIIYNPLPFLFKKIGFIC